MSRLLCWGVAAIGCAALPAIAGDFDGSKNLICAPVMAMDCAEGVDCVEGEPQEMGAPAFLRIDFDRKVVVGTYRSSPILQTNQSEEQILLQGFDEGLGWTVAIGARNGRMYATLAGQQGAIMLHGSCTPL
jgi:hypothetical protein